MCYHVSVEVKMESILDVFPDLIVDPQLEIELPQTSYVNGFDHKPMLTMVTSRKDGKRHLTEMMWGFLPKNIKNMVEAEKFWNGYKDENGQWHKGFITLNAMGEELFDKVLYKQAAEERRCVVFVDGIYEWHHYFPMGKKGKILKTPVKIPHHIYLKENSYPFTMIAGIWNPWTHEEVNEETGELEKFTTPTLAFVTTEANELMAKIHNSKKRMPTILTKELAEEWIQPGLTKERITEIATWQYASQAMDAYSIPQDFQTIINPKERKAYAELEANSFIANQFIQVCDTK